MNIFKIWKEKFDSLWTIWRPRPPDDQNTVDNIEDIKKKHGVLEAISRLKSVVERLDNNKTFDSEKNARTYLGKACLALSDMYVETGKPDLAAEYIDKKEKRCGKPAHDDKVRVGRVYKALGKAYYEDNKESESLKYYLEASKYVALDECGTMVLAHEWVRKQRTDRKAVSVYIKYLRVVPPEKRSKNVMEFIKKHCLVKEDIGKSKMAKKHELNQRAVLADSRLDWAYRNMGMGSYIMKNYDDAISKFNVSKRYPDNDSRNDVDFLMGKCYFHKKDFKTAERKFDEALKGGTEETEIYYFRGVSNAHMGLFTEAEGFLKESIVKKPDNLDAHTQLGNVMFKMGRPDDAYKHFSDVHEKDPSHAASLYGISKFHQWKGDEDSLNKARDYLEKILAQNEDHVWALYSLGSLHESKDELKEACDCYEKVINLDKEFYPAHENLGVLLIRSGNDAFDRAVHHLKTAGSNGKTSPRVNYYLGMVDALNGEYDAAIARWDKIKDLESYKDSVKKNLRIISYKKGWKYFEEEDWDHSLHEFEKCLEHDSEDSNVRCVTGLIYFKQALAKIKKHVNAGEELQNALTHDPGNSIFNYYAGINLLIHDTQQIDKIQSHFDKASENDELRQYSIFFKELPIYFSSKDKKTVLEKLYEKFGQVSDENLPEFLSKRIKFLSLHHAIERQDHKEIDFVLDQYLSNEEEVISNFQGNDLVDFNLALCYVILQKPDNNLNFGDYIRIMENHNQLKLARAVLLAFQGKHDDAIDLFDVLSEQVPDNSRLRQFHAKTLFNKAGQDIKVGNIASGISRLEKAKTVLTR